MSTDWQTVIGLEVHLQLATQSKIFSGSATSYGSNNNSQACALDLALPGTLPTLNRDVVAMAVKFGLSINATIARRSIFARKNYFYPDLPKGYQITQYESPIVEHGFLDIRLKNKATKRINIIRAHLEEDAGKSIHQDNYSLVDFNRAGVPLLEVVSAPEMNSAKEASAYLKTLHILVKHLDICSGNMQEGAFRCDANISVNRPGEPWGTRVEVKNINSFRFVEKAIEYEQQRQISVLEQGGTIAQETRLYDAEKQQTRSMRSKENAHDYRYFPEPDLLPLIIDENWISEIKAQLPELPQEKFKHYQEKYQLAEEDALLFANDKMLSQFYEQVILLTSASPKLVANWLSGDFIAGLNKLQIEIERSPISPVRFAGLLDQIAQGSISGKAGKEVLEAMWETSKDAQELITELGLQQNNDSSAIDNLIDDVLTQNQAQLKKYLSGKTQLFGFFVGQVMKLSKGAANPELVNHRLKEKLKAED